VVEVSKCSYCNKPNVNTPICDDCNFHEEQIIECASKDDK